MAYISNQLGCGSEKKDYQNDYASQYNKHDSVYGPSKYTQAGSFFESNFSTFGSWGSCKTGEFGDYIDDALAASAQVMATFESGYSNNDHAVIIQKALDGDTYKYYDPQKDTFGSIAASKIKFAIGATDCK